MTSCKQADDVNGDRADAGYLDVLSVMRITNDFITHLFHLDHGYSLLDAQNVRILIEWFNALDIHKCGALNDIQFHQFVRNITDLSSYLVYDTFDMLDVDGSGEIEPDEFSLLLSILIAIKDGEEKQFIYRHSRTVFDLLDEDGSNTISAEEFGNFGFLFNFQGTAIRRIFHEYDISGDQELDYKEFRMFAMACIDAQMDLLTEKKRKTAKNADDQEMELSREDTQRQLVNNYENAMFPLKEDLDLAQESFRELYCRSPRDSSVDDDEDNAASYVSDAQDAGEEIEMEKIGRDTGEGGSLEKESLRSAGVEDGGNEQAPRAQDTSSKRGCAIQ